MSSKPSRCADYSSSIRKRGQCAHDDVNDFYYNDSDNYYTKCRQRQKWASRYVARAIARRFHKEHSLNVAATTNADSVNATHRHFGPSDDRCHGTPQQTNQEKEARHEIATWYQKLSTDQKNA